MGSPTLGSQICMQETHKCHKESLQPYTGRWKNPEESAGLVVRFGALVRRSGTGW